MSDSPPKDGDNAADVSQAGSDMEPREEGNAGQAYDFDVKEQDRWLPIANVARIMKTALPDNAKIAKEAKECMQECVSEFISFITSEASEKCQQEKRKTVNGEDILFAMTSTGFENYAEALKIYLGKYRERGENQGNQPRPGSSFGANQATSAGGASNPSAGFPGPEDQILSPQLDPTQQDGAYAAVYPQGPTNNGVSAEHY